ncbi:MAG: acetyl-CoA carboxylase biotin carboxyl carrier protein [bacterium]|nr:acetyl-CoA carboxylase biotin carboxyl carrier protein [bacterium]MCP4800279.1 acetyl-CoA carboxylase biotin carboxyl carrier protein [bacterium]
MDLKKIKEFVKLVEDSGIHELEITSGDNTIRIKKQSAQVVETVTVAPAAQVAPVQSDTPAAAVDSAKAGWKEVTSPIVGTYYSAPSPDSPAFVNVGDKVSSGQVLCIVEAMKVMNEIEAEFSGTIKEICVSDSQPIEAEALMFLIDPS